MADANRLAALSQDQRILLAPLRRTTRNFWIWVVALSAVVVGGAGASAAARRAARTARRRERARLLFTHRGFSGPVVLDISRHVTARAAEVQLLVRWGGAAAPDWEQALRPAGKRRLATILDAHFPERFVRCALELAGLPPDRRESETSREERQRLVELLERYPLPISGSEGYATAEVTGGGVALSEVYPKTLESRRVPGLHFCGEILDAIGRIGGYNFLWAWVTGRTAGQALTVKTSIFSQAPSWTISVYCGITWRA